MKVLFQLKAGNSERWEIIIEGESWREVHRTIFGRKPIFPPLSSENDYLTIFDEFEYKRVKGYVLWRLSTQSYHSEQLAKMLRERLVQSKTIERVLREFQEAGFLDDQAWLKSFVRLHQKRYGLRLILAKLQAKGLSANTLRQLTIEGQNPEEEVQAIRHLILTRYRKKNLNDYKEKQKVVAALMRKGYAFDQIQAALRE